VRLGDMGEYTIYTVHKNWIILYLDLCPTAPIPLWIGLLRYSSCVRFPSNRLIIARQHCIGI